MFHGQIGRQLSLNGNGSKALARGPDAARARFDAGLKKSSGGAHQQFLYQAWATMEAAVGDVEAARAGAYTRPLFSST